METLKTLFIVSVALLAAACAMEPPIPVTVDSGTIGPRLSVPITFRVLARPPD